MTTDDESMGGLENLLADLCEKGGAKLKDLSEIALAVAARRERMRHLEAKLEALVHLHLMREDAPTDLERRVASLEALRDRLALEAINSSAIPQFHDMDHVGSGPGKYSGAYSIYWACRYCGHRVECADGVTPHVFGACDVLELQKRRQAKSTS